MLTLDHITEQTKEANASSFAQSWKIIPTERLSPVTQNIAHRLNALGDNFYFIKIILKKHRLSNTFHRDYCNSFLKWHLKQVNEIPRDHFKTTIGVGHAMWWALPFNDHDEKLMRQLGYDDAWIAWMRRAHDQNTRTLIAMEIIKNAWKVGKKISSEYKSNHFFRSLFSEIIPDSSCQWTADTMTHKRDFTRGDANQGEGTYEFTGVDAALQSKHFNRIIYDDLFGREALKSELVAESTWEWFQLAVGAFDSDPNDPTAQCDEIVNGNRWSFHDLNYKIKENLPYFKFNTHDAEGGCCPNHPAGKPIFPEEWTMEKLREFRSRLGEYLYSCQFRNSPIAPGGNVFKQEWLRYFVLLTDTIQKKVNPWENNNLSVPMDSGGTFSTLGQKLYTEDQYISVRHMMIRHEMVNGVLPKDIATSSLSKMLMIDPNHKGEGGRANHALMLVGVHKDPLNVYVLDGKADTCSREDIMHHSYMMGERWRVRTIWVEIYAGQTWCKTAFEIENEKRRKDGKWFFNEVREFKDNRAENAKADRIEDCEPFFRRGQIHICQNHPHSAEFYRLFMKEYSEYPHCKTRDTLDILGHGIQNLDLDSMSEVEISDFVISQQRHNLNYQHNTGRNSITGY